MTRKSALSLAAVLAAFGLGACQTLDGVGRDVEKAYASLFSRQPAVEAPVRKGEAEIAAPQSLAAGDCPPVQVMDELGTLVEFSAADAPSPENEVSRIHIDSVAGKCSSDGLLLSLEIEIAFTGGLGPKARLRADDRPSFAYPYFVAVTDPNGDILAKELFAASVSYGPQQNTMKQVETIFQSLPLSEDGLPPDYSILVGFQLDEQQLAYNRAALTETAAGQ